MTISKGIILTGRLSLKNAMMIYPELKLVLDINSTKTEGEGGSQKGQVNKPLSKSNIL